MRAEIDDRLWVPVLTHYRSASGTPVDRGRMLAHLRNVRGDVSQIMLAGSTGDGWELDDGRFEQLIDLAASREMHDLGFKILFGVLRLDTAAVVARLRHLEARLADAPHLAERFCGVAVCPPVDAGASQEAIGAHYRAVFDASRSPIAVYQLPQVTGCRIAPQTMEALAGNSRVTMFKDSSGEDIVAEARLDYRGVVLLRGAEGGYSQALQPAGPYHGWLLSTGNALGASLQRIVRLSAVGESPAADDLSARLSSGVAAIFEAAAGEGGANAFSNANRAMDHLRAYGAAWRAAPAPLKVNGEALSQSLMENVERLSVDILDVSEEGYLGGPA